LLQPWLCNHALAGALTIAFDERALSCLRGIEQAPAHPLAEGEGRPRRPRDA
jgi:hypothetical protein